MKAQQILALLLFVGITRADVSHLSRQYLPPVSRTTSFSSGSGYSTGGSKSSSYTSLGLSAPLKTQFDAGTSTLTEDASSTNVLKNVGGYTQTQSYTKVVNKAANRNIPVQSQGIFRGSASSIAIPSQPFVSQSTSSVSSTKTGIASEVPGLLSSSSYTQRSENSKSSYVQPAPKISTLSQGDGYTFIQQQMSQPLKKYDVGATAFQAQKQYVSSNQPLKQFLPSAPQVPSQPLKQYIPPAPLVPSQPIKQYVPSAPQVPSQPLKQYIPPAPLVPSQPIKEYVPSVPQVPSISPAPLKQYVPPSQPIKQYVPSVPQAPSQPIKQYIPPAPLVPSQPIKQYVPSAPQVPSQPIKEYVPSVPQVPSISPAPIKQYVLPSQPIKQYVPSVPQVPSISPAPIKQYVLPSQPLKQYVPSVPQVPSISPAPIKQYVPPSQPIKQYVPSAPQVSSQQLKQYVYQAPQSPVIPVTPQKQYVPPPPSPPVKKYIPPTPKQIIPSKQYTNVQQTSGSKGFGTQYAENGGYVY